MKTLSFVVALLLFACVSPAAAQYSFSGSPGVMRTAPSKPAAGPTRPTNPSPPTVAGAAKQAGGPQAAKPPSQAGVPLHVPGQSRAISGKSR